MNYFQQVMGKIGASPDVALEVGAYASESIFPVLGAGAGAYGSESIFPELGAGAGPSSEAIKKHTPISIS